MRLLAILFLFLPLGAFSQKNEIFQIDSLPKEGILLDKGWKWHAGDSPDFAKADFDDSKWEGIDPTKDIFDLKNLSKNGDIFWLRLPLFLSQSISKESLIMTIKQSGASEIFLDGKLVQQIGVIDKDKTQIKAISPGREPFSLRLLPNQLHILAVRYAFQPNIKYGTHFANTNSVLRVKINSLKSWHIEDQNQQNETNWNIVVAVIFATLCVLYFAFYLFFPSQKINLFFAIYNGLQFLPYGFSGFFTLKNVDFFYGFSNILIFTAVIASSFLLLAIYRLFEQKIGIIFWLVLILGIFSIFFSLYNYQWGWVVFGIGFNFSINLELFRIAIVSFLKNKKGAWIIASGGFIFCVSWILFLYSNTKGGEMELISNFSYALAQIAIPISVAINLGYNFAKTNISLQQKLLEVEVLSSEKQQILESQNEQLDKLVAQRTQELKASQAQLIQSEKLASLGELTAGIAHEIQNPLNFVTNFSEVSGELVDEMKEEIEKGNTTEVKEIAQDLKQNLEKINHHGKRASDIVKGMLGHSRNSTGEKELTDINAMADEYLRLSYHGLRAKDNTFISDFKTDFDENLPKIEVVSQDMGRVLLNLINNAFYATKGVKSPLVEIKTAGVENGIIVSIKDNGKGMSEETKAKIFQPFFTTKPTGEGTGLGLSLAYDIVTKGHGGTIEVESVEGEGTEFIVKLPIQTI
ncbi:ATP-binding protein [Lacihabitans sp. CS3-21]|uniref:ATP-binding protein n=1 Tax=Lacihabitans sp. CS3-21 TaxID=2487332 RepID=UPI0020CE0D7B|nr:ATP-binding protein [Lacihabitans sp. CS3-21]